ncbi:MAG: hypothetical protein OXC94_10565 [Chloroflexi bacterium]|nr:hypothetical protein [Chloroflexota bacterium]
MVTKACVHRYELDQPVALEVHGRCRLCGHERTWPQYPKPKAPGRSFRINRRRSTTSASREIPDEA